MHETLIKRTLWVAECQCNARNPHEDNFRMEFTSNPPREVQCSKCGAWIEPKELSYTGKDLKQV